VVAFGIANFIPSEIAKLYYKTWQFDRGVVLACSYVWHFLFLYLCFFVVFFFSGSLI